MISFLLACAAVAVGVLLAALERPDYDDSLNSDEQPSSPAELSSRGL